MATIHINNRSDFQILLKAEEGKTFPEFDFTLAFQTTGGFRYNVMSNDSKRFTPNTDRTQAVITFDFANGDYFPNGRLAYTIKAEMQNAMFADGYENTQTPRLLDVIIWDGASDYSDAVEVDFVLPYVSVQAKSISPALLDTSNIIRKRLPYGAMAYQLYYTQLIRVPNALATQDKFDDKVPQWFSEFLQRQFIHNQNGVQRPTAIRVCAMENDNPSYQISVIGVINAVEERNNIEGYKTSITYSMISPSVHYKYLFFELPKGVYYFDANRALRRYRGDEFLPTKKQLSFDAHIPQYNATRAGIDEKYYCNPIHTYFQLDGDRYDQECWVKSKKQGGIGNDDAYYYWKRTRFNFLRTTNNAPLRLAQSHSPRFCYVRIRSGNVGRGHGKNKCSVSQWRYFHVVLRDPYEAGSLVVRLAQERYKI